jgi:VIT1/CCC1 family predicted Fe2+/Mn2+ transporter
MKFVAQRKGSGNRAERQQTDLAGILATHTPRAIQSRLATGPHHSYLRDFIYGAVDGIVTTFAVVSGVAGAGFASEVVIVLGAANLAADGFSMGISNYLGTRADRQLVETARRTEEEHINECPDGEREEVRQIFRRKGLEGNDLEQMISVVTSDRNRWINTMIQEEYGLHLEGPVPWRAATVTFLAFVLSGTLPLLPFVCEFVWPGSVMRPYGVSSAATALAFFMVGAVKGRFVYQRWFTSGAETCLAGGAAAMLAYTVGVLLGRVVS